jgi:excisionase family DNA binding protein
MDLEKFIKSAVAEAVRSEMQLIMNSKPPVFLTTSQAAEILQVNGETVRRFCRRGKLKYVQVGKCIRIEMRHIQQFAKDNEI